MKSAVVLMVRNEARDIAEWIAFHALAGFSTQVIFDNRSDDGTTAIVKAAAGLHDIRYHDWPYSGADSQTAAYAAAVEAYKLEFDWMAFLDSDEFLLLPEGRSVADFLAPFEEWSGIAVNWALYGSDGHVAFPPGLVMESFTRRAGADFFPARHVKSIIRPGFAGRCLNPHCFELRGHRRGSYATPRGTAMQWWPAPELGGILPGLGLALPDYTVAKVNHYFTRSRAHWVAKLARGYPADMAVRKLAQFDEYDRNEVADPADPALLAALRRSVEQLRTAALRLDPLTG